MDRLTPARRSYLMSRVRSRDTSPEKIVRQISHALGYRFRLHNRNLPGTPDLVFPRLRSVIFVNGCFWHRHPGCKKASIPGTRVEYWTTKFTRNVERDACAKRELKAAGWRVLVVWECETKHVTVLRARLNKFLSAGAMTPAQTKPAGRSGPKRFFAPATKTVSP